MNTALAAVIVALAIIAIVAAILIPILRSRGRNVGWAPTEGGSASPDSSVGPGRPGSPTA